MQEDSPSHTEHSYIKNFYVPHDTPGHRHGVHDLPLINLKESDQIVLDSSPIREVGGAARRAHIRDKERRKEQRLLEEARMPDEIRRRKVYQGIISHLAEEKCSWGELMEYVFDPKNGEGHARYEGFFSVPERVGRVLDFWVAADQGSVRGRDAAESWALRRVIRQIEKEAKAVTHDGFLRTETKTVDADFASSFSFQNFRAKLEQLCPTMIAILTDFCTTHRQRKSMSAATKEHRNIVSVHQFELVD